MIFLLRPGSMERTLTLNVLALMLQKQEKERKTFQAAKFMLHGKLTIKTKDSRELSIILSLVGRNFFRRNNFTFFSLSPFD